MADERVPVGGRGNFRILEAVDGTTEAGRVIDRVDIGGDGLAALHELITEVRAVRRGLELALGTELITP